eukprot:g70905.t1
MGVAPLALLSAIFVGLPVVLAAAAGHVAGLLALAAADTSSLDRLPSPMLLLDALSLDCLLFSLLDDLPSVLGPWYDVLAGRRTDRAENTKRGVTRLRYLEQMVSDRRQIRIRHSKIAVCHIG